jgi:creatinine amidohydrolase
MKTIVSTFILVFLLEAVPAQKIPYKMEELTAPDFIKAVVESAETCILPIGVFEKHGPHMPLGTDLLAAREIACRAVQQEYAVVFPWYYFSQINEARHQPGTIAYSPDRGKQCLSELLRNGAVIRKKELRIVCFSTL